MRLRAPRSFAPLALLLAVHASGLTLAQPALAQPPRAAAAPQQDLVERGRALFDDQQYEESIQTLSGALVRPNNTKTQKLEIYRLLALNYITLGRKDESESAVRGLLSLQPDYALPASESPRFRDFFAAAKQKWETEGRPGLVKETPATANPVSMVHTSPEKAERKKPLDLTATLVDPQHAVTSVKVFYRRGSSGDFESADATVAGDDVRVTIPAEAVKPTLMEYYLQGFDAAGQPLVSRGDSEAPLRIPVPEPLAAWVLPVAIGGGALVVVLGVVGGILLSSKSSSPSMKPGGPPAPNMTNVTVNIGN
jgi:tetratricopeptide (TPR) repeat protein